MAYDVDLSRQSTNRDTVLAGLAGLLSPYVDVTLPPYNVVGDGTTDDTDALNDAIAANAGKTLIIPAGRNCLITDQILFSSAGTRLVGHGATLTEGAGYGVSTTLIRVSAANVRIEGLTLVGAGTDKTGIVASEGSAPGVQIVGNEISGCGYGIIGGGNHDILIEDNYVHDCSKYTIWCQNNLNTVTYENCKVLRNRCDTSHLDPATGTQLCILVRGTATYPTKDVEITGNRMVMPLDPTNSTALGCEMRYVVGGSFASNHAKNGAMLVSLAWCSDVTVDGNVGDGQTHWSIEVANTFTPEYANIIISNNTVHGRGRLNYGIGLQGTEASSGCMMTGNSIRSTTQYGIFSSLQWDSVSITGNNIYMDTAASNYGVFCQAASGAIANLVISGNLLNGTSVAKKAIYLDDVSYASIAGNTIVGWTENGIYLQSDTGTVDYITLVGNIFINTTNVLNRTGAGAFGTHIQTFGNPDHRTGSEGMNALDWFNLVLDVWGTGSPEGVVTAGVGSIFRRRNGSTGTTLYVKETGTGNTGWVAK